MVRRIPTYVPVLEGVVRVLADAKLKQYSVPVDKSSEGNVTTCPATAFAVSIPGRATEPVGKLVVVTVQFEAVGLTIKPVGNTI